MRIIKKVVGWVLLYIAFSLLLSGVAILISDPHTHHQGLGLGGAALFAGFATSLHLVGGFGVLVGITALGLGLIYD